MKLPSQCIVSVKCGSYPSSSLRVLLRLDSFASPDSVSLEYVFFYFPLAPSLPQPLWPCAASRLMTLLQHLLCARAMFGRSHGNFWHCWRKHVSQRSRLHTGQHDSGTTSPNLRLWCCSSHSWTHACFHELLSRDYVCVQSRSPSESARVQITTSSHSFLRPPRVEPSSSHCSNDR